MKKLVAATTVLMCGTMMLAPGMGSAMTEDELQAQIDALLAQLAGLQTQLDDTGDATPVSTGGAIAGCAITSFDRNLKAGMTGSDVKCLQIVLNSASDTVLGTSGAGSPGNETSYFGPITKAGVIKFQEKYVTAVLSPYGLTKGTGFVGSTTRAQLNTLLAAGDVDDGDDGDDGDEVKAPSEITDAVECVSAGYYWSPTGCHNGADDGDVDDGDDEDVDDGDDEDVDKPAATDVDNSSDCIGYGYYWGPTGCYSETAVGSGLTVALSDSTPVAAVVPMSATNVTFTAFDVTAGADGDVVIEDLTITRGGVGAAGDFAYVYLYDNSTRLTRGKTINSTTNKAVINNVNITVPAGTTKNLSIVAEMGTTSGTDYLEISSVDDMKTDASSVNGDFPIRGNTMSISSTVTAGTVTIVKHGSLTDPYVGQKNAKIAQFKITAGNENIYFEQVNLVIKGTISGNDVTNLVLYDNSGTQIASIEALTTKDLAEFVLDSPITILEGNSKIYYVTADLTGESTESMKVYLDERTDLVCTGATYGFGVGVTMDDYDNGSDDGTDASHTTLQGGDVTFVLNGPSAANVATNSDDVEFMNVTLTTTQEITVKRIDVTLTSARTGADDNDADNGDLIRGATTEANLKDIKIVDANGDVIMGPESLTVVDTAGDIDQVISFTDTFTMEAGESKTLSLRIDVDNNCPADQVFNVLMDIDTSLDIEDANGDTVPSTNIVPFSDIQGHDFTTATASLTISSDASVQSATKVIGSEVNLVSIGMTAAQGSDITVDQIVITGFVDKNTNATPNNTFVEAVDTLHYFKDVVMSMKLYKGSVTDANQIGTIESANAAGKATFDNLSWTIPGGDTTKLYVTGALTTVTAYQYDEVKVDIEAATDVIAYDADGNDAATTGDEPNQTTTSLNTAGTEILLTPGGALAIDIPTNTPNSDIMVMGSADNNFSKIKFTGTYEDFKVSKFAMKNAYSSGGSLGDYDNNIVSVKVTYPTNATASETEIKECTLSSGLVTCTGLNLLVPNPDIAGNKKYAVVDVKVDLQTDAQGATAAEAPAFTFSLAGDLEATGLSSGRKLYEQTVTITDVTGGTDSTDVYTAANGIIDAVSDVTVGVLDSTKFAVGDIIWIDETANGSYDSGTEEYMYISELATATTLTVVRGVSGSDAETSYTTARAVYEITSMMATNAMTVYETDLALSVTGPTASGSTNASETVMQFTLTADSAGDVEIRQGQVNDATVAGTDFQASALDGAWTAAGGDTLSNPTTGGIGNTAHARATEVGDNTAGLIYTPTVAADLSAYTGIGFWARSNQADEGITLTLADSTGTDETVASGTLAANVWTYVELTFAQVVANRDAVTTMTWAVTDGVADADETYDIDRVVLFSEKITVDLTLNEAWAAQTPTIAYLKQGGTMVAVGYSGFPVSAAGGSTGIITFVPVSTYGDIVITGDQSLTIEMDTASAITDNSTATEKLTVTIDESNSATATGDIYWYSGSATVAYTGINSTDKQSNTLSY